MPYIRDIKYVLCVLFMIFTIILQKTKKEVLPIHTYSNTSFLYPITSFTSVSTGHFSKV